MFNCGIDLVKIKRFDNIKNNDSFMKKTFCTNELKYIKKTNYSSNTIAGIYACKEAFLKALKKGINNHNLLNIEVCHDKNNAPFIVLHNELQNKYNNISVSISHDGEYAISIVIIL